MEEVSAAIFKENEIVRLLVDGTNS
jgi:hypothetical protein